MVVPVDQVRLMLLLELQAAAAAVVVVVVLELAVQSLLVKHQQRL
jgi:hypothetical protein